MLLANLCFFCGCVIYCHTLGSWEFSLQISEHVGPMWPNIHKHFIQKNMFYLSLGWTSTFIAVSSTLVLSYLSPILAYPPTHPPQPPTYCHVPAPHTIPPHGFQCQPFQGWTFMTNPAPRLTSFFVGELCMQLEKLSNFLNVFVER
jgi:hypothetical protein